MVRCVLMANFGFRLGTQFWRASKNFYVKEGLTLLYFLCLVDQVQRLGTKLDLTWQEASWCVLICKPSNSGHWPENLASGHPDLQPLNSGNKQENVLFSGSVYPAFQTFKLRAPE